MARRLALVLWALGACSARPTSPPEPPASELRGTVTFRGVPPKPRHPRTFDVPGLPGGFRLVEDPFVDAECHVRGAFVYVKRGLEGRSFQIPESPVVLQVTGLTYEPRVVGVRVGQPLVFQNLDRMLHVPHVLPDVNPVFDRTSTDERYVFRQPEVMVPIRCDIHPWMRAWVGILDHPYFTITDEAGNLDLGTLPAGKYTIGAWHERLSFQDQEIVLPGAGMLEFVGTLK
jgi:hypothetical protein